MRVLLQFRGLHNDLRLPEFIAVLSLLRRQPEAQLSEQIRLKPTVSVLTGRQFAHNPKTGDAGSVLYGEIFYYADLIDESEARKLASRCVLLRSIYIPVGHGRDYHECIQSIDTPDFQNALKPVRCPEKKPTFRCFVDAFGKKYSIDQQLERIHKFSDALRSFPGTVRMKDPDHELWILEDAFPRRGHGTTDEKGSRQVLLGRKIASGQGHLGAKYSLKRRNYIGPTSMDAELSFVMANMAHVEENHLINDPFCGTGGILIACAAHGAFVIGGDINLLALRGKGAATISANFTQYGLVHPLGILRADVMNSPIRKGRAGWFDAIVCDPPYGIKEGMKVFREDTVDAGLARNHFQGTQRVRFVEFLHGVIEYSANVLVEGGRLVYWLPTTASYRPEDAPTHPALKLVSNCEQPLTTRLSRRLITMQRVSENEQRQNERALQECCTGRNDHTPAHFDLARKLLRQPERAETRLRGVRNDLSF